MWPYPLQNKVLLRYEIGASRPSSFDVKPGKLDGYEFAVTLVFAGRAGNELKEARRFRVGYFAPEKQWYAHGFGM